MDLTGIETHIQFILSWHTLIKVIEWKWRQIEHDPKSQIISFFQYNIRCSNRNEKHARAHEEAISHGKHPKETETIETEP